MSLDHFRRLNSGKTGPNILNYSPNLHIVEFHKIYKSANHSITFASLLHLQILFLVAFAPQPSFIQLYISIYTTLIEIFKKVFVVHQYKTEKLFDLPQLPLFHIYCAFPLPGRLPDKYLLPKLLATNYLKMVILRFLKWS